MYGLDFKTITIKLPTTLDAENYNVLIITKL